LLADSFRPEFRVKPTTLPLRVENLEDRSVPAVYYVSNAGVNGSAGTSTAAAWQTLQYAADRVNPGDTVVVLPGSYAGFNLTRDGTAAARITFSAQAGTSLISPTT